ncbi:MAG: hypothetical protein R3B90_15675 [Planctomycetaceae bacterium]
MLRLVRHPEARVVAVVLLTVLASETGLRVFGDRLSNDVAHLASFDELASELAERRAIAVAADDDPVTDESVRALFLGNSLTRYGVARELFEATASTQAGRPVLAVKVTPDNTAIADWFYAYRNFFAETGRAPDLLIIGFEHRHLADAPSYHPQRLARFYCDRGDWEDLCRLDLSDFESKAAFLAASQSALLSNRDRIERRALDLLIPGYADGIQELNSRLKQSRRRQEPVATYERLARLIDLARADGVRVILAAMPVPTPYELDEPLLELVAARNVELLDCRQIEGVTDDMFPDGLHMNSDASARYTTHLANTIRWSVNTGDTPLARRASTDQQESAAMPVAAKRQ